MEYVSSSSNPKNRQTETQDYAKGLKTIPGRIVVLLVLLTMLIAWEALPGRCIRNVETIREMPGHYEPFPGHLPWPGAALLFFQPLDINQASMEELDLLPGVGEKGAEILLNFRMERGFILSIHEIDSINGPFSRNRFENIKNYITTGLPEITKGNDHDT